MVDTIYRHPLPPEAIAFSSAHGRRVFAEALAAGGMDGYFPLAEQFHTQSEPAYCGLGSLVVALNALAIDPGRLWKGPWRWFGEELLDCCVPLDEVRRRGLDLDEVACLARCNGAEVALARAALADLSRFRGELGAASRGEAVMIAAYDRATLGQTGAGHFSPVGGYHAAADLVLLLDVARFKYPPHWVPAEHLWRAMHPVDLATGHSRGWLSLRSRARGLALGFTVKCAGESFQTLADRVEAVARDLRAAIDVPTLARALTPLAAAIEIRTPTTSAHRDALTLARDAIRALPAHGDVARAVGDEHADTVTLLLLAIIDLVAPDLQSSLRAQLGRVAEGSPLAAELANLQAQLAALSTLRGPASKSSGV